MRRLSILAALFIACLLAGMGLMIVATDGTWHSANHWKEAMLCVVGYMTLGMAVSFGVTLYAWGEHEEVRFLDKKPGDNMLEPLGRWMYEGGNGRKVVAWLINSVIIGALMLGLGMITVVSIMSLR